MSNRNGVRFGRSIVGLLLLFGCGDGTSEGAPASSGGGASFTGGAGGMGGSGELGGGAGDASGGSAGAAPPLFVAGTRVWDPTGTQVTSYFHVLPALEADTEIDPGRALEVAGSARLYSVEGAGWFAIGGGETPNITRYTLDASDRLVAEETIGLQSYGVLDLWDTLYPVSATKLYYPDRANGQLIVINPSAMTIDGVIELPDTLRDGYLAVYGYTPVMRGDRLLFSIGWFDWESTDSVIGETGLVVIDTRTDSVERIDVDSRCGGISQAVVTGSGDAYFVSSALAGAAHRLGRAPTAPCALRVSAASDRFDADYALALDTLGIGTLVGEPMPDGGGGVLLRAFDELVGAVASDSATWELTGQAAWRWWRWSPASGTVAELGGLAPSTADVLWFQVDGHVFGTETPTDYSATTLIDLTGAGAPGRGLVVPGFLHALARIR